MRSVPTKLAQCSAHAKLPSERYQPVSPETAPRPGTDVCMYSPLCTNRVQKRRGLAAASRQFHSACHSARFACVRQPSGVLHCGLVLHVYLKTEHTGTRAHTPDRVHLHRTLCTYIVVVVVVCSRATTDLASNAHLRRLPDYTTPTLPGYTRAW